MRGSDRVVLVGQAPGPNTNPRHPLHPAPCTSAGGRLLTLTGLHYTEYMTAFQRVNLLQEFPGRHVRDDKFPRELGRVAAQSMEPFLEKRVVVFMGRNVARAFGYQTLPFHTWQWNSTWNYKLACAPHTSGRNRWYNRLENRELASSFWLSLVRDLQLSSERA